MQFQRKWAMPNHKTFLIRPIKDFINDFITDGIWIDPFARDSVFNDLVISNDLSLEHKTDYHMESLEFLKMFDDESVDGVLFDPPYSPRQLSECYKSVGRTVHQEDTQSSFYGNRKNEISRILRPGGWALCFGWNSNGIGKTRGFDLMAGMIVAHGGAHNDTICTAERKVDY